VGSGHSVANNEDFPDGFQMTELGPLPKEWRVVRLGEVAEKPQYGFTAAARRDPVGPKILRITDIQDGSVNWNTVPYCECGDDDIPKYLLEAGDILFARTGSVGKTFLVSSVPEPSIFASYLIRIRVDRAKLDPQFAFLFMQSAAYWSQIASQTHGAVQPNVNATQLRSLLLPLPPLPEQRAIAHVLRTVQRAKEATEGVIAALKELKKSLMQHLFTYGPVPVTERERVPLQETEIGPIPAHWRVVRLGELVEKRLLLIRGGFPQGQHNEVGNGVPHLRPFNITNDGNLDLSQIKYIAPPSEDDPHWLLPNDVIFNNTNSEELVGKTALFDRNGRFVLSNHMTLIRILEPKQVDAFWLSRQLHYFWHLGLYKSLCRRHVNQASISLERLKGIAIPFPPFDEQREIARMLQAVDAKIAAEERRRAALEELFKTLLHALMSGRMRVPHILGGERSCDSNPDADKLPKSED
jgi:type I restriction enzyme S subunit